MPLYRDFSDKTARILVWKFEESEVLDVNELLENENFDRIKNYQEKKLLEALMVRKALKSILPTYKILYQEREPYLEPRDYFISITHSFPFAAIAISKKKIGIDMERFNEKILRVEAKFLYPEEASFIEEALRVKYLTIIWSVKESLYKIHHSNYWSLKKNYKVEPFQIDNSKEISCCVYDSEHCDQFSARVEFFDDYCFSVVD